jgi:hypothetical protein
VQWNPLASYIFAIQYDNILYRRAPQPYYYTKDGYAKRLIGNSFSIPAVEILLRPLQAFYSSQEYPKFNYEFAWTQAGGVVARGTDTPTRPILDELQDANNSTAVLQDHVADVDGDASEFSGMSDDAPYQDAAALDALEAASMHDDDTGCFLVSVSTNEERCQGGVDKVDWRFAAAVSSPETSAEARKAKSNPLLEGRMDTKPSVKPTEKLADKRVEEPHSTSQGYGKENHQHNFLDQARSSLIQSPQLSDGDDPVVGKAKPDSLPVLDVEKLLN